MYRKHTRRWRKRKRNTRGAPLGKSTIRDKWDSPESLNRITRWLYKKAGHELNLVAYSDALIMVVNDGMMRAIQTYRKRAVGSFLTIAWRCVVFEYMEYIRRWRLSKKLKMGLKRSRTCTCGGQFVSNMENHKSRYHKYVCEECGAVADQEIRHDNDVVFSELPHNKWQEGVGSAEGVEHILSHVKDSTDKYILERYFVRGQKWYEIAADLGLTPGRISQRVKAVLAELRVELADEY